MKEKINELDIQTQVTIKKGAKIYNSLRNSFIMSYGNLMPLEDKRWLAMYLGILQSEYFFSEILKKLNYDNYIDYELRQAANDSYDEEFYRGFEPFVFDNCLEVLTLFLLEQPVIKDLNAKVGYSRLILKNAIYDQMNQKLQNNSKTVVNSQKVLTNNK